MDLHKTGRRMLALRGAKTREEAAKGIGISVSALTMYELGRRSPRDAIKEQIARYYGVCAGGLFFDCEQHETCYLRRGSGCARK